MSWASFPILKVTKLGKTWGEVLKNGTKFKPTSNNFLYKKTKTKCVIPIYVVKDIRMFVILENNFNLAYKD